MDKKEILKKIKEELKLDDDKIKKISAIFDNKVLSGKLSKDKIIKELTSKLSIDEATANKIYNKFMSVVGNGIKDKIKSLFK